MSLTFPQVQQMLHEIKPLLEGALCRDVIAVSPSTFVIAFKQTDAIHHLLLCFKERYLRFHLCPHPPLNQHAGPFINKLKEILPGERLIDCCLLNEDRILALSFQKNGKIYRLVNEFLPRRPNCYLLDASQHIMAALYPVDHLIYDLPSMQGHVHKSLSPSIPNLADSHAVVKYYEELEHKESFEANLREIASTLKKQLKSAQGRVSNREKILEECSQWNLVHHDGLLLKANLFHIRKGMHEVVVSDWELAGKERKIPLDPLKSPQEQLSAIFHRAKKLQAGLPHAEKQLRLAEEELALRIQQQEVLDKVVTPQDLESFCKTYRIGSATQPKRAVIKAPEPAKPYHVFQAKSGLQIWVGKSAKENDKLSFHFADGNDWWLHAHDYPGSHVVVRGAKGQELDADTLSDAAELALRFSKAKDQGKGEVSLTQVKALRSVKGCPGKVMLSKYKVVYISMNKDRWERLKESRQSSSSLNR